MKLVCHSCGTRHSLDEDRVAGERVEIHCRSCEQVLVHAADPKAVWHAAIGGKQVGPLHQDELARRRREGDLDEHSLVWREGLADWVPLSTITELEQSSASSRFVLDDLATVAAPLPTANPYVREGSGLHEIRGIAEAIAPPMPRFVDDPGSLPAGLAHSMVIVPEVRSEPKPDRRIVFVLSTALASVTLLATLLVVFIIHEDRDPQASPEPIVQSTRVSHGQDSQREIAPSAPQREVHPELVVRTETSTPEARDPVTRPDSQVSAERARTTTRTPHRTTTTEPPVAEVATPSDTPMPPALTPVTSTPEPPAAECSEVDCVISGYAEACCFRHRPAATTTPERPAIELPESLDRAALTRGIATIDAKGCSGASSAPGVVSLAIKVSPEGTVTSVAIKSTPDDALAACVTAAAYKGVFRKTKRGGSFSYPWRF